MSMQKYFEILPVLAFKQVFETKTCKVSTNADIKLPVTQDSKEIQRSDNYEKYQECKKDDKNKYFMQ